MFKKNFFSFIFLFFLPYVYIHSSLIDPDLAPKLLDPEFSAGYDDFAKGRSYFYKENWDEAIHFFSQAVKKSYKPTYFECDNYHDEEGYGIPCKNYNENKKGFLIGEVDYEIMLGIYRHSHFHLGLIRLYQGEFLKANLHLKKAIGFNGIEDNLGFNFYKCANILNPSWIALASLLRLQIGNIDEAKSLIKMGLWTLEKFEYTLDWNQAWNGTITSKYWENLRKKGFTETRGKWQETQLIILYNTASIIANAQNNLEEAIDLISTAIQESDYAIRTKLFSEESKKYFVLYFNRGTFYLKAGFHQKALADFTKAIALSSKNSEIYFQRGNIYLFNEEYSKALDDFNQAIALEPNNSAYYLQRSLAYTIRGSLKKAEDDLKLSEIQKNKVKNVQNELGIDEFSKGNFQQSVAAFKTFIEKSPSSLAGYQNIGIAQLHAEDLKSAIENFDIAISIEPDNADLYLLKAISFMNFSENKYFEEAENNLAIANKLNPTNPVFYQTYAIYYFLKGNLDAAISNCNKALSLSSKKDPILNKLVLLHFMNGDHEKALEYSEKLEHTNEEIIFIRALCFFEKNEFRKSIDQFELALQMGYKDESIFFHRAKAYFSIHEYSKALEDVNKFIERNSTHIEGYKLRGLILLSLHRELEAYKDFSQALSLSSLKYKTKEEYHPNVSMNLLTIQHFKDISQYEKKSLIKIINEIDLEFFGKGLIIGLADGGKKTLKELGPFLSHLVFHPVDTMEELLTAIKFIVRSALKEDWETVCEALAPELKELFKTWDKIDDYHKGHLLGIFIGKNGTAALTAFGVAKTFSKLKNVVIGYDKTKFSSFLKKTKTQLYPLPVVESLPISANKGWSLTSADVTIIEKQFLQENPLVQIVLNTILNKNIFEKKASKKLQSMGHSANTWEAFETNVLADSESVAVEFRKIAPPMIETEVKHVSFKSGKLEVIFNDAGEVASTQAINAGKILIRNKNAKKHIMQPKHAWDKLIQLTGDIEADCSKLVKFLEGNEIHLKKYRLEPIDGEIYKNFIRYDHQATIQGFEVVAIFNESIETGEIFLNDAWVIAK